MITAFQMAKWVRRVRSKKHDPRVVAYMWAKRVEGGPGKSCIPKKKLRAAGLLPPVRLPGESMEAWLSKHKKTEEDIKMLNGLFDGPKLPTNSEDKSGMGKAGA